MAKLKIEKVLDADQKEKFEASRTWMQRFVAEKWHAVFRGDGEIGYCSCGRPLEKIDEQTYRCSSGYPVYSLRDGNIFKDKFGALYISAIPHNDRAMNGTRENTTGTVVNGKGKCGR